MSLKDLGDSRVSLINLYGDIQDIHKAQLDLFNHWFDAHATNKEKSLIYEEQIQQHILWLSSNPECHMHKFLFNKAFGEKGYGCIQ